MLAAIKEAKQKKLAGSQKEKTGLEEKSEHDNYEHENYEPKEAPKEKGNYFFQDKIPTPSLDELQKEEKESLEAEIEKIKKGADFGNPIKETEKKDLAEKQAELERLLQEIKKRGRENNSRLSEPPEKKGSNYKKTVISPLVLVGGVLVGIGLVVLLIFFLIPKRKK